MILDIMHVLYVDEQSGVAHMVIGRYRERVR